MKKHAISIFAVPAAILGLLCSCAELPGDGGLGSAEGAPCAVTISVAPPTRATVEDTESEAKVSNIQAFIFRGETLEAYASVDNSTVATLSATSGARTVYVLVNAPAVSQTVTLTTLRSTASSLLSDNASTGDRFVMVGRKEVTLTGDNSIPVNVDRIVSRIKIAKVTRRFTVSSLSALDASKVVLTRLYTTNVVDNNNYDIDGNPQQFISPAPAMWWSTEMNSPATISKNALLYGEVSSGALAQNGSWSGPLSYYVYPNATAEDTYTGTDPKVYTAKVTRLVAEVKIDFGDGQWKYYTYPMLIGAIDNNRSYEIRELVITRLGNSSDGDDEVDPGEDDPVQTLNASFTVTPDDWELVLITSGSDTPGTVVI